VDHALGDALVVEVEDLLAEVEVLEGGRAPVTDPQRVLVIGDGRTLGRRQPRSLTTADLVGLATLAAGPAVCPVRSGHDVPPGVDNGASDTQQARRKNGRSA
jgi:hypothetical protein